MSEYAALVAIDWADQKHAVCVLCLKSSVSFTPRFSPVVDAW